MTIASILSWDITRFSQLPTRSGVTTDRPRASAGARLNRGRVQLNQSIKTATDIWGPADMSITIARMYATGWNILPIAHGRSSRWHLSGAPLADLQERLGKSAHLNFAKLRPSLAHAVALDRSTNHVPASASDVIHKLLRVHCAVCWVSLFSTSRCPRIWFGGETWRRFERARSV